MPESPVSSPWQTRLLALLPLAVLGVVAMILWLTSDSKQQQYHIHQAQRDQEGQAILATARAEADAHDPHWRLIDFPKRLPNLSPEQDAAILFRQAQQEWAQKAKEMSDQRQYLYSFTGISDSYPCNRQLTPNVIDELRKILKIGEKSRALASQAKKLTQGNFPSVGYVEVLQDLKEKRDSSMKLFFGYVWLKNRPYDSLAGSVVTPVCGQAVLDFQEKKPGALDQLMLALHLSTLPNQPSEDILNFHSNGCGTCLLALEWMMGQRVLNEPDMLRLEKQLQSLLRLGAPLKNKFIFNRAVADYFADAYQNNVPQVKIDFWKYPPTNDVIYRSVAECLHFTTEAIDRLDLPLADFHSWFNQASARFPEDATYQGVEEFPKMSPERFFRVYFLAYLEESIQEYYGHQERLRLALIALACERYRLRHKQFPENPEQLRSLMDNTTWNDIFAPSSPIQIHLYATSVGMVISSLNELIKNRDPQEWDKYISMGKSLMQNRYLGFRLYRPELRGQPPLSPAEEASHQ